MFLRGGGAEPNVNFVDWYIDGGFVFKGFVPGRADDSAGIAVAIPRSARNSAMLRF
jgi:Carbohydrate-selective porin, OprB family